MPGLNIAVFSLVSVRPAKAVYFLLYGSKSYVDVSGSGSFLRGLKQLVCGKEYVTPAVREAYYNLPDDMLNDVRLDPTGRQEDVKHLIFRGKKTKEIAAITAVRLNQKNRPKTKILY